MGERQKAVPGEETHVAGKYEILHHDEKFTIKVHCYGIGLNNILYFGITRVVLTMRPKYELLTINCYLSQELNWKTNE